MESRPSVWVVATLFVTAISLTAGLAGCGGGGGGAAGIDLDTPAQPAAPVIPDDVLESEADQMEPPQELPPDLVIVGDSLPAFPGGDAEGPLSAWRVTSEEGQRLVEGNERVAEAGSGNYPAEESDGYVIVPGGDDELSAWVQFSVPEFDDQRPVDIYVVVDSAPLIPGGDEDLPLSYWVGVGNFTHYGWDWYGPYDDDEGFELNSAELKDRFVSEDGVQHFVVLTLAGEEFAGEGNPEGLTAAEVEFTRIDTLTVDDAGYFDTNPHYTWIDSIEVRDGYKGASDLDPDSQYVTLTWTHHRDLEAPNCEAFTYQVERQLGRDGEWVLLGGKDAPGLFFVDPTDANIMVDRVIPGATYYYRLRSLNIQDGFSVSLPDNPEQEIPLLPPTDLAASDGDPADQLVLTWTKSEGATEYRIFRDGQEPEDLVVTVGDVDTYTDTDIKDIDLHSYRIKAKNDYAVSDWSNEDTGFLLLVAPVAMLTGDPLDGEFPLEVHFDASESHDPDNGEEPGEGIVQYEFQFDTDGSWVDNGDDPWTTHVYEEEATYRARVRVTDNDGQVDTSDVVPINDNDPPVAELDAAPLKGEPPLLVSFDASGSHDDDGEIDHYDWDWENDDIVDETTSEASNDHTYETSGKYTARVDVVDDDDAAGVAHSAEIVVNLKPTAVLTAEPEVGVAPLTVDFDASLSSDDGSIVKYEFDFDEGAGWEDKGLNATPDHTYDDAGCYQATVRVWDDFDDYDDATVGIYVGEQRICYVFSGNSIWVMNVDGSAKSQVTTAPSANSVAYSPDRSRLAYNSSEESSRELYVVNVDGTGKLKVSAAGTHTGQMFWEDNDYILFRHGDSSTEILRIKADGTDLTEVSPTGDGYSYRDPVLSPDGKRIAYGRHDDGNPNTLDVYVADYPGFANQTLLASISGGNDVDIPTSWGVTDVIALYHESSSPRIYLVNSDGTGLRLVEPGDSTWDQSARFTEDAASLVFHSHVGSQGIWMMDSDGSNPVELTSGTSGMYPDLWVRRWPKAMLEASPTDGAFPLTVNFDASDSYDMDNGSTPGNGLEPSYEWDFDGDGTWDSTTSTATTQHTYTTWGVYRAWVRVTDDEGDTNTACIDIGDITWNSHTVDSTGTVGLYTSIVELANGKPAISYWHVYDGLKYARAVTATPASGSDWSTYFVDNEHGAADGAGPYTSMALNGKPIIAYHYFSGAYYEARFASASTEDPTGAGHWSHHTVASDSGDGYYNSLVVLDGKPAFSYWDAVDMDLCFARATTAWPGSSIDWSVHQPDTGGADDVGKWGSLAILDGKPAVSYFDQTDGELWFGRAITATPSSGANWLKHMVDDDTTVGEYTTMVVIGGKPMIAYYDSMETTGGDLKFARATTATPTSSSDWVIHVVDSDDTVGYCNSMAVIDGRPAISYHDYTNKDLKFAWAMTPEPEHPRDWLIWEVDTTDDVGLWTSLTAIGGMPYISYYDDTSDDLKFARGE